MTIKELLQRSDDIRITLGERQMFCDNEMWTVIMSSPFEGRKSKLITDDEDRAIVEFLSRGYRIENFKRNAKGS